MSLNTEVTIIFRNKENKEVSIGATLMELLEKNAEDFQEALESSDNCCCFNEGQNFCECTPEFDDYDIFDIVVTDGVNLKQ